MENIINNLRSDCILNLEEKDQNQFIIKVLLTSASVVTGIAVGVLFGSLATISVAGSFIFPAVAIGIGIGLLTIVATHFLADKTFDFLYSFDGMSDDDMNRVINRAIEYKKTHNIFKILPENILINFQTVKVKDAHFLGQVSLLGEQETLRVFNRFYFDDFDGYLPPHVPHLFLAFVDEEFIETLEVNHLTEESLKYLIQGSENYPIDEKQQKLRFGKISLNYMRQDFQENGDNSIFNNKEYFNLYSDEQNSLYLDIFPSKSA